MENNGEFVAILFICIVIVMILFFGILLMLLIQDRKLNRVIETAQEVARLAREKNKPTED